MSNSEQWKLDGKCSLCRRKTYCSKPCKAYKNSTKRFIKRAITEAMDEATDGNYSKILNMSEYGEQYLG